jgi:Predicted membrane protein (DUF2142)
MRLGGAVSRVQSFVKGCRSRSRVAWWTTFALVSALGALWVFANPLFAGPDEPSHVVHAVAVDRGQLTGESLNRRLRTQLDVTGDVVQVRVPAIYARAESACFAFQRNETAACAHFEGPTRDAEVLTTAGRHPPAYYAAVGVASWVYRPGSGTVYLMRLITALITAAFVATAVTALRRTAAPKLVAVGVLLGVTPMVLFIGSVVNPSGPETAAALALWVCGLVLVSKSQDQVDNRLVIAAGIAGCAVALSRQLGPLWLALIALTLLLFANRASLRNLARSNLARVWAALIVACSGAQLGWNVAVGSLGYTKPPNAPDNIPTSEIARFTVGSIWGRTKEMIGVFGWLDTPAPAATFVFWIFGVGFIVLLALAWSRRRQLAALLFVLGATIIVPVTLESAVYGDAGGPAWQGRYALPLAVGIPVVAGMALASSHRWRELTSQRLFVGLAVMLVVAHALAFAQNLRRYTVGYDGEIQYWKHPQWLPPLSPILLTIAYVFLVTAFVVWVLFSAPPGLDGGESDNVSRGQPSAAGEARANTASNTART